MHVGHGRGAAYGDSLARIMRKVGYDVHKEHYVNDAGNQIINMAYSVYERYKELFGFHIEMKEDYYFGKEMEQENADIATYISQIENVTKEQIVKVAQNVTINTCLLYTSPSPRD